MIDNEGEQAPSPKSNKTIVDSYSASGLMLNQVRSQAGYSLRDLGAEIGVNASTLCRLENGKEIGALSYIAAMMWIDRFHLAAQPKENLESHKLNPTNLTKGTIMAGPDSGQWAAFTRSVEDRLRNIERAIAALARREVNGTHYKTTDSAVLDEIAGVQPRFANHDAILKAEDFSWPTQEQK